MQIDRYTKAVLTVIAGCLLWICAMGAATPLTAQPGPFLKIPSAAVQPVVVVGTGTLDQQGTVTINFIRPSDGPPRTDPTLPVQLPYTTARPLPVGLPYSASSPMPSQLFYTGSAPLPVEISAIKKVGDWEPLRAKVEDAPARSKPGGGGDDRR
jgi:hypothetical protein